jgi:hypothetical protein
MARTYLVFADIEGKGSGASRTLNAEQRELTLDVQKCSV